VFSPDKLGAQFENSLMWGMKVRQKKPDFTVHMAKQVSEKGSQEEAVAAEFRCVWGDKGR
jgi:hypothetical protein